MLLFRQGKKSADQFKTLCFAHLQKAGFLMTLVIFMNMAVLDII